LASRLDSGWNRIRDAPPEDAPNIERWQDFWIDLLHRYEQAARESGLPHYDRDSDSRR
jgi:hypothetical protein